MYGRIKAYANTNTYFRKHQVYMSDGSMIEIMADGKRDARNIAESYGYKVSFVTYML